MAQQIPHISVLRNVLCLRVGRTPQKINHLYLLFRLKIFLRSFILQNFLSIHLFITQNYQSVRNQFLFSCESLKCTLTLSFEAKRRDYRDPFCDKIFPPDKKNYSFRLKITLSEKHYCSKIRLDILTCSKFLSSCKLPSILSSKPTNASVPKKKTLRNKEMILETFFSDKSSRKETQSFSNFSAFNETSFNPCSEKNTLGKTHSIFHFIIYFLLLAQPTILLPRKILSIISKLPSHQSKESLDLHFISRT